jgi:predicted acylesterase/phospholipase RssA
MTEEGKRMVIGAGGGVLGAALAGVIEPMSAATFAFATIIGAAMGALMGLLAGDD